MQLLSAVISFRVCAHTMEEDFPSPLQTLELLSRS